MGISRVTTSNVQMHTQVKQARVPSSKCRTPEMLCHVQGKALPTKSAAGSAHLPWKWSALSSEEGCSSRKHWGFGGKHCGRVCSVVFWCAWWSWYDSQWSCMSSGAIQWGAAGAHTAARNCCNLHLLRIFWPGHGTTGGWGCQSGATPTLTPVLTLYYCKVRVNFICACKLLPQAPSRLLHKPVMMIAPYPDPAFTIHCGPQYSPQPTANYDFPKLPWPNFIQTGWKQTLFTWMNYSHYVPELVVHGVIRAALGFVVLKPPTTLHPQWPLQSLCTNIERNNNGTFVLFVGHLQNFLCVFY